MDLKLDNKLFLIGGATSGFGKAITEQLIAENAKVIAVARTESKLLELQTLSDLVEIVTGDLSSESVLKINSPCSGCITLAKIVRNSVCKSLFL